MISALIPLSGFVMIDWLALGRWPHSVFLFTFTCRNSSDGMYLNRRILAGIKTLHILSLKLRESVILSRLNNWVLHFRDKMKIQKRSLNDLRFTVPFKKEKKFYLIQFNTSHLRVQFKMLNSSIWPINKTFLAATPGQSESRSNGISQTSSITGASPFDTLASYPAGRSYHSAEW